MAATQLTNDKKDFVLYCSNGDFKIYVPGSLISIDSTGTSFNHQTFENFKNALGIDLMTYDFVKEFEFTKEIVDVEILQLNSPV